MYTHTYLYTYTHIYIQTYTHKYINTHTYKRTLIHTEFFPTVGSRNIAPWTLGLFVKKWLSKVDLAGYDILFAYSVVEAKSKKEKGPKMVSG